MKFPIPAPAPPINRNLRGRSIAAFEPSYRCIVKQCFISFCVGVKRYDSIDLVVDNEGLLSTLTDEGIRL